MERALSVFAPVHRGEATTALLMMVNVFVLLTAYYLIKPVREALILGGAGAEMKSYAGAGQAMLFLLLVPLYSAFASRTNRVRLINGVTAFFISNLIIFYFLGRMGFQLGIPFCRKYIRCFSPVRAPTECSCLGTSNLILRNSRF